MSPNLQSRSDGAPLIWPEAFALAARAHAGQLQSDDLTPYISHPCRVAMVITREFKCGDDSVLAAAVLHDVLEKTSLTPEKLRELVGEKVTGWVEWLSKGTLGPAEGYWALLATAPWEAKLIKLADCFDHLGGPVTELEHRIQSANKALAIVDATDPHLSEAVIRLSSLLAVAEARMATAGSVGSVEG